MSGAVGPAGGVLLTETIAVTGLGRELSAALAPWRKPLAVHARPAPAREPTARGNREWVCKGRACSEASVR